jgi:micrococcal nuclease
MTRARVRSCNRANRRSQKTPAQVYYAVDLPLHCDIPASGMYARDSDLFDSLGPIPDSDHYKLPGHDFPGHLVAIDDSDRLVISYHATQEAYFVRLHAIDAPEKGQPYWQEAKDFLYDLSVGKWLKVSTTANSNNEGALIAIVDLPTGKLANEALVKAGFAWMHDEIEIYSGWEKELKALEQEARESKRGLWTDPHPVPPSVYRKASAK